eukprot:Em0022g550a
MAGTANGEQHAPGPAGEHIGHRPHATSMDWDKVDWSKWSHEEQHNLRHRMLEEKHRGHDMMHTEMILILFGSILLAQLLLYVWRQKHRKSYQLVTLVGLWLIPMVTSCKLGFWRMVAVWCVFSAITVFAMYKATRKKLRVNTPRRVYRWFLFIYQATYVLGILGYLLLLLVFTGLGLFFHPDVLMESGVTLVFYGVYYGVMGRDCAEMCVDFMAASMTYTAAGKSLPKVELTSDMCAVCGQRIVSPTEEGVTYERTYRLNCNHLFHEFCIRGWCIVGKKQTCPYCQEKVDLKRLLQNPWEKPHMLFGQLLDFVRYFVVWLPVILVVVQLTYHLLNLE